MSNTRKDRTVYLLAALVALIFLVSACGSSGNASDENEAPREDPPAQNQNGDDDGNRADENDERDADNENDDDGSDDNESDDSAGDDGQDGNDDSDDRDDSGDDSQDDGNDDWPRACRDERARYLQRRPGKTVRPHLAFTKKPGPKEAPPGSGASLQIPRSFLDLAPIHVRAIPDPDGIAGRDSPAE